MMKVYLAILTLFFTAYAQCADEPFQLQSQYEGAVRNSKSTQNPYVLISLTNGNTNQTQFVCVQSPFLIGAIHHEYDIPYDKAGTLKAEQIALSNESHAFTFIKKKSLANIPIYYTDTDLKLAREKISKFSDMDLIEGLSSDGKLQYLYGSSIPQRDALACALVERMLFPQANGSTGRLLFDK